jgi:hypothetical protein
VSQPIDYKRYSEETGDTEKRLSKSLTFAFQVLTLPSQVSLVTGKESIIQSLLGDITPKPNLIISGADNLTYMVFKIEKQHRDLNRWISGQKELFDTYTAKGFNILEKDLSDPILHLPIRNVKPATFDNTMKQSYSRLVNKGW